MGDGDGGELLFFFAFFWVVYISHAACAASAVTLYAGTTTAVNLPMGSYRSSPCDEALSCACGGVGGGSLTNVA